MAMKTNDNLRGAAFHEAGHVIVARELGLPVGEIAIGVSCRARALSSSGTRAASASALDAIAMRMILLIFV